jgi:23S rRNA pseudouridine1911/1915/1917 synthase
MSFLENELEVVYEDNHLIFVKKPFSFLVQADKSGDEDLLTFMKKYLKKKHNKPGDVFLGLVHRLDRPAGGLMVFAKTSKAASRLSDQIRNRTIQKDYFAVVKGTFYQKEANLTDTLVKDSKKNFVTITSKKEMGKEAKCAYKVLEEKDGFTLLYIKLLTGRFHQIRVQFSSRGFPLYGDVKYGGLKNSYYKGIALWAGKLTLIHPTKHEELSIKVNFPNIQPWSWFSKINKGEIN